MKKVLVIGDSILDINFFGSVDRISPEAPVPVFDYEREEKILGGALNVAANIRTLGTETEIHYLGFYTFDVSVLMQKYNIKCIGVPISKEEILTKVRVFSNNQQLLRIDYNLFYDHELQCAFNENFKQVNLGEYDLIVVSDYNKNTLSKFIWKYLHKSKIPIIVDLKDTTNIESVNENFILKCNKFEWEAIDLLTKNKLLNECKEFIVTSGKYGYELNKLNLKYDSLIEQRDVVDVTGAGDTFLAGMAVYFLEKNKFDADKMARYGNRCAGKKIMQQGTVAVSRKQVGDIDE